MAKKRGTKKKPQKQATPNPPSSSGSNDVEIVSLCTITPPVLLKVCRLCETKDGPFLNIFDPEKVISKKIEELMPFGIAENDDLPHKICFRCSAKVEELHEFIQKCIKTQENLCNALGKKGPLVTKTKTQRLLWEEKLNKNNISNDDICNAVIKKAMESIKIPLNLPLEEETLPSEAKSNTKRPTNDNVVKPATEDTPIRTPVQKKPKNVDNKKKSDGKEPAIKPEKHNIDSKKIEEKSDVSIKPVNLNLVKCDQNLPPTRTTRSKPSLEGMEDRKKNQNKRTAQNDSSNQKNDNITAPVNIAGTINDFSIDEGHLQKDQKIKSEISPQDEKPKIEEKPFNIMDHVGMIKVNGVGVLFQCRMCNRNFLNKDVVASHGCAKNSKNATKNVVVPEPPKPPTVKYLNIKLDEETKKKTVIESKSVSDDSQEIQKKESNSTDINVKKPKPKIGPASKVRREVNDGNPAIGMVVSPREPTPPPVKPNSVTPSVQFPAIPSLNSRYKLVPGPNNTFTLVEEHNQESTVPENVKTSKKRKSPLGIDTETKVAKPKIRKQGSSAVLPNNVAELTASNSDIIDLDEATRPEEVSHTQPYPVGLFKTVPHHSSLYTPDVTSEPAAFTTTAMKKQSYTIVQTGNPSKLLISSKPQPTVEEAPKKRLRKSKAATKEDPAEKQPFSVTLEDAAPRKDAGFFTFINVDPLLQPSYVLPTDNIIQESQISTSTHLGRPVQESNGNEKEKYTCNMCGEGFTREKKLLAHIQSHYSKMDEEDQLRSEKTTRKRGKKS